MENFSQSTGNNVAKISIKHFENLPKTGKPNLTQWIVLASIVQENLQNHTFQVVSLATGSKCIGQNQLCSNGSILNDSHAEVLCRRGFLRYLYEQIRFHQQDKISIFSFDDATKKYTINNEIKFHFFCSQMPCGDASIFPKQTNESLCGHRINTKNSEPLNQPVGKRKRELEHDIYRTGAKCLKTEIQQDPHLQGLQYHTTGPIRTKPGRGDPTLSVSCSDKLARWIRVGIQGALLSMLIDKPVYLSTITIGGNTPYCETALKRALLTRFLNDEKLNDPYFTCIPELSQSELFLPLVNERTDPCPSSIIWSNVEKRQLEIAVDGRKQGVTKKNLLSRNGQLMVCKKQLCNEFVSVIENQRYFQHLLSTDLEILTYDSLKKAAHSYQFNWNLVKEKVFKTWTNKDGKYLQFQVLDKI